MSLIRRANKRTKLKTVRAWGAPHGSRLVTKLARNRQHYAWWAALRRVQLNARTTVAWSAPGGLMGLLADLCRPAA